MKEYFAKILAKIVGFDIAAMAVYLMMFNAILSTCQSFVEGLRKNLEGYAADTKTDLDDKALMSLAKIAGYISKALALISKIIDVIGANRKH